MGIPRWSEGHRVFSNQFNLIFTLISPDLCQQVPPNLESQSVKVTLGCPQSSWSSPHWLRCHCVANSIAGAIWPSQSSISVHSQEVSLWVTPSWAMLCTQGNQLPCPDTASQLPLGKEETGNTGSTESYPWVTQSWGAPAVQTHPKVVVCAGLCQNTCISYKEKWL